MHHENPAKWLSSHLSATGFLIAACVAACAAAATDADKTAAPQALFNGEDLKGWVVDGDKTAEVAGQTLPVWTARDGMIHCAGGGFGFLRFDQKFSDFTLSLEYRLQPGTNSGVGIRTVEYKEGKKSTRPSRAAYEIQLVDDGVDEPTKHSTGAIYLHSAARAAPAKPAGEWNRLVIKCIGPRIRVKLNGEVIQDYDQRKSSKTKKKPLRGYISLQNHGGEVDYRDILLKDESHSD